MAGEDRYVDLDDVDPATGSLVTESELTGRRTVFLRAGRPVAILTSWDEHLAARETIEIAADAALMRDIANAEKAIAANDVFGPEDLFVE